MIFSELIKRIIMFENIEINELADYINVPVDSLEQIKYGNDMLPKYNICNSIYRYCVQNNIPFDDFDWNEVVYEWFQISPLVNDYEWADDIDDNGYVQLKHKTCGRCTRVPISALQNGNLLCLHCWIEKQNISDKYSFELDENSCSHRFIHECGQEYYVTYSGLKSQKFRCPKCTTNNKEINPEILKDSLFALFLNDDVSLEELHEWEIYPSKFLDYDIEGTTLKKYIGYEHKIEIPEGISIIGEGAFENCEDLKKVTIPSSVKRIEKDAFASCEDLSEINFDKNSKLYFIGKNAFGGCFTLKELSIPRSISKIEVGAFNYCGANLLLDTLNPYFYIIDGMLCSKETNTLIECFKYDKDAPIVIPNYIKHVGDKAFAACNFLKSIIFEEDSQLESIGIHAFDNCDGIKEIFIPDNVKTIREGAFYACKNLQRINFANNSQLTIIEKSAFECCHNLTEITVPSTVKNLGESAFCSCEKLSSVVFLEKSDLEVIEANAFYGCDSLQEIIIPSNVKSIKPSFENISFIEVSKNNLYYMSVGGDLYSKDGTILVQYACGKQKDSFDVPNTVSIISESAFCCCSNLSSVSFPESLKEIEKSAFSYCTNLDNIIFNKNSNLKTIGNFAFSNCENLTEIKLPSGLTNIGDSAFEYCSNIKNIILPDTIQQIGKCAFFACDEIKLNEHEGISYLGSHNNPYMVAIKSNNNLYEVSLPSTTAIIYDSAFKECKSLKSINIPDSVINIGDDAFGRCRCLTAVNISKNVATIGKNALANCEEINVDEKNLKYMSVNGVLYTKDGKCLIQYPTKKKDPTFKIPIDVAKIEDEAFIFCDYLQNITISPNVEKIGYRAFYSCDSLVNVIFEENSHISIIEDAAFESCKSIERIMLPQSVKFIGINAFAYCYSLTTINFGEKSKLQYIGCDAFYHCDKLKNNKVPPNVKMVAEFCQSREVFI